MPASISQWENQTGGRMPTLAQFDVLAEALELTLEEQIFARRLARARAVARRAQLTAA